MTRRRIALALAAALLLFAAGFAAWRVHRAEALFALFLPRLRDDGGGGFPSLRERGVTLPRGLDALREHHAKFIETAAPAPEELVPLPLPEGATPVPLRRPFLAWGKTLEPKLKTFKDLLRELPLVLKEVYAVAVPKDLGVFPQNARTPLLAEPLLRDTARFMIQLSAAAGSLGRLEMAALLATYPCNLGVASVNLGQGFGNATALATYGFALELYRLGASALLSLADGPLPENARQALDNAGAAIANLQPLHQVAKIDRDLYFDALESLAAEPAALSRKEEVGRALKAARAEHDELFAPLLAALETGDREAVEAPLARYAEGLRLRDTLPADEEGLPGLGRRIFAAERLLARHLLFLPPGLPPLVRAEREARALAAAMIVAARLARLEADGTFPTTAGYFETLCGAKLPRAGFDPRRPVDLAFENGRATVRDGGRITFSRPFGAK